MKKLIQSTISVVLTAAVILPFASCNKEQVPDNDSLKVELIAISGKDVGVVEDCDYFVVPEPAASTKVAAIQKLNFVGDLQGLYGEGKGYTQAVLVAKKEIIKNNSQFINEFTSALSQTDEWLLTAEKSAVVSSIVTHLPEDSIPTFNAKNLTDEVIKNCNINFVWAQECKAELIDFVDKMGEVNNQSFGTASDEFFYSKSVSTTSQEMQINVYAPDGAPALSLSKLMSENNVLSSCTLNYNIVDATTIQTFVAGANPKADVCILPSNLAVKLLGSGQNYQMLGAITHGNLFILSGKDSVMLTKDNLNILNGKRVGVVNLGAVPGLVFKSILKDNNFSYSHE